MPDWKPYFDWDLNTTGLLPSGWRTELFTVIEECGTERILTGETDTSTEPIDRYKLSVVVVTGDSIFKRLPWLFELYTNDLLLWAAEQIGRRLFPANDIVASININKLSGIGARYEWHKDTNPLTGVLFVTDADASSGGELIFTEKGQSATVWPRTGLFIAFDAREIPHRVTPLRRNFDRISIPMNYYTSPTDQERPDDLNTYLYGPND